MHKEPAQQRESLELLKWIQEAIGNAPAAILSLYLP